MEEIVYVVTRPGDGWDCVIGVFTDKEYVEKEYSDEEEYVITTKVIDRSQIEKEWGPAKDITQNFLDYCNGD